MPADWPDGRNSPGATLRNSAPPDRLGERSWRRTFHSAAPATAVAGQSVASTSIKPEGIPWRCRPERRRSEVRSPAASYARFEVFGAIPATSLPALHCGDPRKSGLGRVLPATRAAFCRCFSVLREPGEWAIMVSVAGPCSHRAGTAQFNSGVFGFVGPVLLRLHGGREPRHRFPDGWPSG